MTESAPAPAAQPALTCEEKKAVGSLSAREHFRIRFFYGDKMVDSLLKLPLTMEAVPVDEGTQCLHLELWLKEQFLIPQDQSVFAVVPVLEAYSPPMPLMLLNTIAFRILQELPTPDAPLPILDYALVVRPLSNLNTPIPPATDEASPFHAIDGAALGSKDVSSLARQRAQVEFVTKMKTFGFARVLVTREQAQIPLDAWEQVRTWLAAQLALPRADRWGERVDNTESLEPAALDGGPEQSSQDDEDKVASKPPSSMLASLACFWRSPAPTKATTSPLKPLMASKGRYVGFSCDPNREYLQLRHPLRSAGTVWPRPYFHEKNQTEFASNMLTLLKFLDGIGRDCMEAICAVLNVDRSFVFDDLLDDVSPPPATEAEVTATNESCRYGASVLRVYNYRNKKEAVDQSPSARMDLHMSCGSHADLGLVTVSPCATLPGLQMWNLDRMLWTDVESDASTLHFSVFAGETLGYITNGLIQAPLHRVPATVVEDEATRRMSMPYFLRARPQACLNPTRPKDVPPLTVRDLMEERIFKTRPWRREASATTPDY
ncbi:hypothetical protein H310_05186 [Aphanomyces invadans]|uniref:Isopenicillin N synthase-like Fe(2+) 2OG dioxygenase domain-containing protein n=1 Tax=Aphanomyces invadans TaxID=157072 RepID=A0A024UC29_9STRA|nr:hypothetical protein H310_05186 [Aphanomyces invadans]ETW03829.1 hypothetical protein H310_05186 [Aphanomyces invadans]|eukprot:XP_008868058.1 hypothetical protein H310_05186 [Aphanomyces invadans]